MSSVAQPPPVSESFVQIAVSDQQREDAILAADLITFKGVSKAGNVNRPIDTKKSALKVGSIIFVLASLVSSIYIANSGTPEFVPLNQTIQYETLTFNETLNVTVRVIGDVHFMMESKMRQYLAEALGGLSLLLGGFLTRHVGISFVKDYSSKMFSK